MKKILCAAVLALALALPAQAVRYGVKKQIYTGASMAYPTYLVYSSVSDRMYSGNAGANNFLAMDCAEDSSLGPVAGAVSPYPPAYDSVNNRFYYKGGNETFYAVDCATNTVDTSLGGWQGGTWTACNPDNNKIYVNDDWNGRTHVYSAADYSFNGELTNYNGFVYYYSPNNSVYAPNANPLGTKDSLGVFSGATNALTAEIYIPGMMSNFNKAMASSPTASRLYLSLPNTDQMAIINTSNNTLANTLTVGDNPTDFALCPLNSRMFFACNGNSQYSLQYIDSMDVLDSVQVGDSVSTVVYNPSDSLIYIGCWRSGYVKLVDPRLPTPMVVDSVYTVFSPHFLDMSVDQGGDVYCAMYYSDNIYVIGQIPRRIWRSVSSGMWGSYISWFYSDNGGASWDVNGAMLTPDCATDSLVTIDSTHTIQISGQAEYLDQVVIKAGGGLMIQTSTSLGDTTGYDLDVNGTLMITTADFTQNGQIRFGPNSQYIHGVDGDTIPAADWDSLSSIDILGMMFTQPSGLNQSFGTVIWDGASQEVDMTLAGEAGFSCRNLNVQGTGLARMIICSGTNQVVNIPGTLTVNSSAVALICTTGTNVVRVGGTFSVLNSGQFYISDSSYAAVDTLVLYGDYQHVWTSVHGGLPGTATMVFDGSRAHNYHGEIGEMSGCVDIVVRPGSTLDIEPGYTVGSGSAGSFTLMPGATLKVRDDAGFFATGTDNGAIRVNGARNYSKQANYYFGNGPFGYVYSGDGLPDTVNMLTIDNAISDGWYQEYYPVTVMDTLALLAGYIDANYPITINGPVVVGSGYINGSVPITVSGSGPDIVLPTASGMTLPTLTVDRPGRTVELPQNVNISDTLYLNNGSISNVGWGSVLTVNNGAAVQRTSGWVKGALSKYIDIGTASLTYELGGDSGYTPVVMSFGSVTDPEYLTISSLDSTAAGVDLPANCLKRHWLLNQGSLLGFSGGTATFSYLPSDFNTGLLEAADETAMVAGGYNNSFGSWELQDIGARAAGGVSDGGTIEITGLTATPMAKKKTADLLWTSLFTLAKDLRALQPSKMWRLSGTANYWNSGFWETSADGGMTWVTPSMPDSFPTYLDSSIIIMPGADVTINMDLTLDEVIDSGMIYHTGGALTINDGPGEDMVVNGIVNRQGGTTNVHPGASLVFAPLGQYIHQMDGDTIPAATWDSLSQLNITGVMTTMPAGMDQAFGNISWNGTQQTIDVVLPGGPSFSARDIYIGTTGLNSVCLTSAAKPVLTVNNLNVGSGTTVLGSGGVSKLHVKGNMTVSDPGWLYLTDALNRGIDTLFLYGNYAHMMSGIGGGGPDSTAIVFCGTDSQTYLANSEILTGYINYQVNPGAILKLPEGNTFGTGSLGDFTLMPGATLAYSDFQGIYPSGQDTGVIRNLGARNFSQGANYHIYGMSTGPYYTGPGIPDTVNQLIVESMMDQAYLSKDVAVMDTLKLLGNNLRIDGRRLSLFGPIFQTAGNLIGDGTSQLALMGGDPTAIILPGQFRDVGTLSINRPATVTMTDTMLIYSRLELINGTLDNGGNKLTFQDGSAIFRSGNGSLAGAGPFVFVNQVGLEYGAGTITAGSEMPTSSMAIMYLALKGSTDTLIVDRDTLNIWNSLSVSGGIRFNGKMFSTSGLIDTAGPAGELIFTDTCLASIFGSGMPLELPGINGGALTLDNTGGGIMQRNISCTGPLRINTGPLVVGPNTLILGDSLPGTGSLTADSTSTIIFQGSVVNQILPSSVNHLGYLSWNRPATLFVANPLVLHDSLKLGQGSIDNSTNLTLRSGLSTVRSSGILMMPPVREGPNDVIYQTHGGGLLAAGNEIPGNATDLNNLTLSLGLLSNDTIALAGSAQINGRLSLQQGVLSVGANTLTLRDTIDAFMGQLATDSTSGLQVLNIPYLFSLPASVKELGSLVLNSPAGLALADTTRISVSYRQTSGKIGFGQLIYGPAATLEYNNAGVDTTSNYEFPGMAGPRNLTVSTGGALQLHAGRTIPGTLTLYSMLNTGANTVTVDTFGAGVQGTSFVEGNLAKLVPWTADTTITYELGTWGAGPSPVLVQVYNNTVPAFVTAGVKGLVHPLANDSTSCLKKFWSFSGAGLSADASLITLNYLAGDFNTSFTEAADESTMVAGRYDNGATPGWQFPVIVTRNILGTTDGGSIVLSHTGNFADNPEFTLGRDSLSIFNPAADTTLPFIASNVPLDGAPAVGLTDSVRMTFSEPVRKSLVSYTFVPNPGVVDTVWSADSTTIVFNHSAFAGLTSYTVKVAGVQDTMGNVLTGRDSIGFATMAVDTTPPYIASNVPLDGAPAVGLTDSVRMTFSEPVRKSLVSYTFVPNPGVVDTVWSADSTTIVFNHSAFAGLTSYTVKVAGVQDTMGNVLTGRDSIGFATMAVDTTPPYIASNVPLDGAPAVGLTDSVRMTFSEPVRKSLVSYTFVPNPGVVDTVWSADSTTIVFNHSAFAGLTSYTVKVAGVQDTMGNVLTGRDSIGFATMAVDTTPPYIASNVPLDGAPAVGLTDSVRMTFSEPVRKSLVSYTFVPNPGVVDTVWSADSTTIVFNHSAFAGLTSYTVKVAGVQDTMGNVLTGRDSIGFATMAAPDTIGPYISFVQPFNGQTGVMLSQPILIGFSEPVDSLSLRFTCSPNPGGWTQTWDTLGNNVFLQHIGFIPGTIYSFRLDSIRDISGNQLRTDTTTVPNPWSFTVQANETLSTAWAGGAYRLVSVPLVPADTTALGNFGDDLGAYSDSTWRMFGYNPSSGYSERPKPVNGQGYWMASASNADLDAIGTPPEQFVSILVDSGWNIIGMPFDTTLDLNKITVIWNDTISLRYDDPRVDSVFSQRLWSWNDPTNDLVNDNGQWDSLTPYNPADSLRAWKGYAGYAVRPCTLQISPIGMKNGKPQAQPAYDISWQAVLGVSSGKSFDSGIKIGISPQAREKYDRLDAEKPPFIASTIKAYIPHQDWNRGPCREYQYDFRPAADYIEWPLMVEAARADQPVVLTSQITGELGDEGYLYLLDRRKGKTFDLKTQQTIGFSGSQELAVVYSSKPFDGRTLTPLVFGLGRIGPNPFNQRTTINYQIPQAGLVSMTVYNITGQRVRTLVSQNLPPGYYSQVWDGRNDGGRALSAGVYIVRLSAPGRSAAQKIVKLQ